MKPLLLCATLLGLPLFSFAEDTAQWKGSLCVQNEERRCDATTVAAPAIQPSDEPRSFIWSSDDGKRVILGVVEPQAKAIALDDGRRSEVTLSIRGDRRRGWPLDAKVRVDTPKQKWQIDLPAKVVEKLSAIRIPPGKYGFTIGAEHHRSERRPVDASKSVAIREVVLKPLPAISGRVLNSKDEPLAGVQIVRGDGKIATHTDEQGTFHAELAEPIPEEILVVHPGFASRVMLLSDLDAENDLSTIRLGAGHKVTLRLVRDGEHEMPARVRLLRANERRYEHTQITTRDLKTGEDEIVFADLDAGIYFVVFEGKDPLLRLKERVELKDADVESEVRIAPFALDGGVWLGEKPVGDGTVSVIDPDHSWRAQLKIDERGKFGGTMWQRGKVTGFVSFSGGSEPVQSPELESDPAVWNIRFKNRLITGRVYDAQTKQPLDGARLRLERAAGSRQRVSRFYTAVRLQPDGSYSILAVEPGTYDLEASAPNRITEQTTIEIGEADEGKQIDFPLTTGTPLVLDVTWPSGEPVANAQVLEGVASDGHNPDRMSSTDGAGRVRIDARQGETRTLFILPREGSLAVVRAAAQRDADPLRVVVPLPSASLRIRTRDREGKQVPGWIIMRYNGELLPQPVTMRLPLDASLGEIRYQRLPAGSYELWAVAPRRDYSQLIGVIPAHPAKRVGLTAGDEVVELVAEPLDASQ